jgi:hypothetical protein
MVPIRRMMQNRTVLVAETMLPMADPDGSLPPAESWIQPVTELLAPLMVLVEESVHRLCDKRNRRLESPQLGDQLLIPVRLSRSHRRETRYTDLKRH